MACEEIYETNPAGDLVSQGLPLSDIREAAEGCRVCDLYRWATQTVFGVAAESARLLTDGAEHSWRTSLKRGKSRADIRACGQTRFVGRWGAGIWRPSNVELREIIMTTDPVELRVDRIRDRMSEITLQLAGLEEQADTEMEESGEQAELLAKVTELRDEHRVLEERLRELLRSGPLADDPDQAETG